jgi:hypothetical protein
MRVQYSSAAARGDSVSTLDQRHRTGWPDCTSSHRLRAPRRRAPDVIKTSDRASGKSTTDSVRTPGLSGSRSQRRHVLRSIHQADGRRGGWNTALPRRTVRVALASTGRKEESVEVKPGTDAYQAQEASGPSNTPAGTAGAAGWPEHQAPEQGRGSGRAGSFPDSSSSTPNRSRIKGSIRVDCRPGWVRDVTRWEQPASTPRGASRTKAKSDTVAPAWRAASFPERKNLVIRQAADRIGSPPSSGRRASTGETCS